MKIIKMLGNEKCYLMEDGSKIPFEQIKASRPVAAKIDIVKKKTYKRKKK